MLAAYNARGGSQTIESWGKSHYTKSGRSEGRTACGSTISSSSSTTSTSSSSSSADSSPGCTNFVVKGLYHGYRSNPGMKIAATDNTSGSSGPLSWLHLSCPYSLYYYDRTESQGWPYVHYYSPTNGGGYRLSSSSSASCIGHKLTFSSNRYVDNQCTITNVTKY